MQVNEVEHKLQNISMSLNKKIVLNLDKTVQIGVNLAANASESFCFNSREIKKNQFVSISEHFLIPSFRLEPY